MSEDIIEARKLRELFRESKDFAVFGNRVAKLIFDSTGHLFTDPI